MRNKLPPKIMLFNDAELQWIVTLKEIKKNNFFRAIRFEPPSFVMSFAL